MNSKHIFLWETSHTMIRCAKNKLSCFVKVYGHDDTMADIFIKHIVDIGHDN